jgi:hypothetical protein
MTTFAPAPQPLVLAPTLEDALALAAELVERADALAGALDLDGIDLPDLGGGEVDAARLQALPPLYLASELEEARLVPAAETLAALYVSGGIAADVGEAGDLLVDLWRARNERFNREERQAFFRRLFGGSSGGPSLAVDEPANDDFEGLLIDLAAAIHRLDPAGGSGLGDAVALRTSATLVGASLSSRRAGIPEPAARELLAAVREALAIFKQPQIQRAVGALGPWGAVGAVAQRYLREEVEVPLHVERARTGLVLLAWLAETASGGGSPAGLPSPEVRAAAQTWLEATLSLHERENRGSRAAAVV